MIATTRRVADPFSTVKWLCGFVVPLIVFGGAELGRMVPAGQPDIDVASSAAWFCAVLFRATANELSTDQLWSLLG